MQDQGKRLLLVVALMLGVFLVWSLRARRDEPVKQARTTSPPSGSPAAPAPGQPPAAQPVPAAGATISPAPAATPYAQRFAALCAACHGANGRIETPLTPVLAGQPSLYVITQLFLFREGRRSNEAMTAVAKTLTDDDLQGFSEFIETLPPVAPPPPATPPDPLSSFPMASETSACSAMVRAWAVASRCHASEASTRITFRRACAVSTRAPAQGTRRP